MNCPNCKSALPANAVLCVSCGLDLRTGQVLATETSLDYLAVDSPRHGTVKYTVKKGPDGKKVVEKTGQGLAKSETFDLREFPSVWFVQKIIDLQFLTIAIVILGFCAGIVPGLIILYWLHNNKGCKYRVELRNANNRRKVLFDGGENSKRDALALARMIHRAAGIGYHEDLGM